MLQIYTGSGKGKTTAALGLALRALGHGQRIFLIQFLKKSSKSGELKAARQFKKFKILQVGPRAWVRRGQLRLKDKLAAKQALAAAQRAIESKKCDLLILDELNVALDYGLVKIEQVKKILKNKPKLPEIIITGRGTHPELIKRADLISEIRGLKHYYKKGIAARKGIEY
ncbi:MAG: cob(I)yrinic acid a,c-diamide adenosyltransferase [Candidatus Omnitrophica bacterium]|nr:cob(I)yrinic acid a,c-diamide adenosyltransferase [Candidatus Omnitrophota bacterium]